MSLADGKQRYSITLTKAHVDRFRGLCKSLGMPPTTMAAALDDSLDQLSSVFQTVKDQKGKLGITDLFKMVGEQAELAIEVETQRRILNDQNRKKASRRSKIAKA